MSGFAVNAMGPQGLGENAAMPWDARTFASRHNKKLAGTPAAGAAARQASAMVRSGVDEGVAIATANKRANRLLKRGAISQRAKSRVETKHEVDASAR